MQLSESQIQSSNLHLQQPHAHNTSTLSHNLTSTRHSLHTTIAMPANCTTCASPATLRCGGCADHRPSNAKVWYCSLPCQRADWKVHRRACKLAQFYSQVNNLYVTADTETIVRIFHQVGGMTPQQGTFMLGYLSRVPLSARKQTVGPSRAIMRGDVLAALMSLTRMTVSEYKSRYRKLPGAIRQKGSDRGTRTRCPSTSDPISRPAHRATPCRALVCTRRTTRRWTSRRSAVCMRRDA